MSIPIYDSYRTIVLIPGVWAFVYVASSAVPAPPVCAITGQITMCCVALILVFSVSNLPGH